MIQYTPINIKTWSRLGSCGAFGIAAMELPEIDENIMITTADLCFYSGLERFRTKYEDRLINVGIAEQNMIGIAAGMAKEGLNVFATTYATFASTRCADQVRVNMGYMQLPIRLVGLTAGLSVGVLGATHMSFEDIAIMRGIPNITIVAPADCTETVKATLAAAKYPGSIYLRLSGTMNCPIVYHDDYHFEIGKAVVLQEGKDIALIANGPMVCKAVEVANMLRDEGIICTVLDMHTIKPLDTDLIKKCLGHKLIITLEEHSVIGGLGGAVAEYLSGMDNHPLLYTVGISDKFVKAASYEYLLEEYGLTVHKIKEQIIKKYNSRGK